MPRASDGKVSRHHWFKNARVNLRRALDEKRDQDSRRAIRQAQAEPMVASIKELFQGGSK